MDQTKPAPGTPTKTPGRPSKASPELARRIALLILEGNPERQAAEACGLDAASFFSYLAQSSDPQYADFARIIEEAKSQRKTWRKPTPPPVR